MNSHAPPSQPRARFLRIRVQGSRGPRPEVRYVRADLIEQVDPIPQDERVGHAQLPGLASHDDPSSSASPYPLPACVLQMVSGHNVQAFETAGEIVAMAERVMDQAQFAADAARAWVEASVGILDKAADRLYPSASMPMPLRGELAAPTDAEAGRMYLRRARDLLADELTGAWAKELEALQEELGDVPQDPGPVLFEPQECPHDRKHLSEPFPAVDDRPDGWRVCYACSSVLVPEGEGFTVLREAGVSDVVQGMVHDQETHQELPEAVVELPDVAVDPPEAPGPGPQS